VRFIQDESAIVRPRRDEKNEAISRQLADFFRARAKFTGAAVEFFVKRGA
jgi:hypothetical protein